LIRPSISLAGDALSFALVAGLLVFFMGVGAPSSPPCHLRLSFIGKGKEAVLGSTA
jgi:hypothetical protein